MQANEIQFGLTCTRRIQFCAGHRVEGHENKCAHFHGHNYVAFIHARADELDEVGRVIDFSVLKGAIGGWIEDNWDHGFILKATDALAIECIRKFEPHPDNNVRRQKLFTMKYNPTAENMALFLLEVSAKILHGSGVQVHKVVLWETENCHAEASLSASTLPPYDLGRVSEAAEGC